MTLFSIIKILLPIFVRRHGLFIIGNMSKLAAKSETWKKIQTKLSNRDEIGTSLTIEWYFHKSSFTNCVTQDVLQSRRFSKTSILRYIIYGRSLKTTQIVYILYFSQVHGTISNVSTDKQFQTYAPEGGCTNVGQ